MPLLEQQQLRFNTHIVCLRVGSARGHKHTRMHKETREAEESDAVAVAVQKGIFEWDDRRVLFVPCETPRWPSMDGWM